MTNETSGKAAAANGSLAFEPRFEGDAVRSFRHAYHEIADRGHVVETDALEQLRQNIAELADLHGRLKYMMSEISNLIKKS